MKQIDFEDLIGEATEYDKKSELEVKKPKSWLKSVSAFANTLGGSMIFGVDNDGYAVGLENPERDAEIISEKIKDRLDPIPETLLRFHTTDNGQRLIVLDVFEGNDTPYFYIGDGQTIAYIRVGNESVPAKSTDLKRLVLKGSNKRYDELPSGYYMKDYAFSKLRERYKVWNHKSFEDTFYESFNICGEDGQLTNVGALLADESPIRHSRVFCTRWGGLSKGGKRMDAIDSAEYSGSLITLLQEAQAFVKRNSRVMWNKAPTERIEYHDYLERPVQEALVNAFAHRDYLELGSEVHVDMYDDRLEIYSPGGMLDGTRVQDQDIRHIPSRRRNPLLADLFEKLGYMERQGSGLKNICDEIEAAANYTEEFKPEFYSDHGQFTVTLWNMNYNSGATQKMTDKLSDKLSDNLSDKLSDREKQIVELINEDSSYTAIEMAEKMSVSRISVNKYIGALKEKGVIERVGSNRKGYWIIKQ